jgi:hypothetical protein
LQASGKIVRGAIVMSPYNLKNTFFRLDSRKNETRAFVIPPYHLKPGFKWVSCNHYRLHS